MEKHTVIEAIVVRYSKTDYKSPVINFCKTVIERCI